ERNLIASRFMSVTSLRSMATLPSSSFSNSLSVSTPSASIRPLTRNTTMSSPATSRSTLKAMGYCRAFLWLLTPVPQLATSVSVQNSKLRAIRNRMKIKRIEGAGKLFSSQDFVKFVILIIFVRGSSAEFEFVFLNLQGLDSGIKSCWGYSELGGGPCRSRNPASTLSQSGLDHFLFSDVIDLHMRRRLNPRCRIRRFRKQPCLIDRENITGT